jgi:thiol-disulfide isomerase/thioredoxin
LTREVRATEEPKARRGRSKITLAVVALGTVALAAVVAVLLINPSPRPTRVGRTAPAFNLALLDGSHRLSSGDLRGHPTIVNFWASWCSPCRHEMPAFERAYRKYHAQGLQIVGVDVRDTISNARAFVKKFGITYPIVRDPNETFTKDMGIGLGLPDTFFLDATGRFLPVDSGKQLGNSSGVVAFGDITTTPGLLDKQIARLLGAQGQAGALLEAPGNHLLLRAR